MKKILILICVALFFIVSCGKENKKNSELKVALAYKPRSYNPHKQTDSATLAVTKQIYNNLFSLGDNGEIIPELVDGYEINKDNSITIELKKGIKFHDGSELTAQDVKNSLNDNIEVPVTKILVGSIKNIEVMDKYKLKIEQSDAPSILLHNLAHSSTAITKKIVPNEQEIDLVGTGAFKIKDWKIAEKVMLEAFDDYYNGKPKIDYIVFETVPESSNRMIGLETGELDIAYDISPTDIKMLKKKKGVKVISESSLGTDFVTINTQRLKDKRVRQAIDYAIDKKAIVDSVYEGNTEVAGSVLPISVFGYTDSKGREKNIEKAKELLKEANAKNLKLQLWIYDETSRRQMAQIIQANLKEIGIDVDIQIAEVATFLQHTALGKHDMLIGLWYVSTGDADYGYYPLLHSSSIGATGNRSFYSNKEVDKLLDEARQTSDLEKRKENYKKVSEIILDEVPLLPISYKNYTIGLKDNISGFEFKRNGNHILYNITKKE